MRNSRTMLFPLAASDALPASACSPAAEAPKGSAARRNEAMNAAALFMV